MTIANIKTFFTSVLDETRRVTWPSYKETLKSSLIVLLMICLASLFFLGVDMVVYKIVNLIVMFGK
jgi:preprotein translocase subunit SecE